MRNRGSARPEGGGRCGRGALHPSGHPGGWRPRRYGIGVGGAARGVRPAGRRPPGRGRGCGHPQQVAPRDAILDRSSAPQTGDGAAKLAAAGPLVERTCLGTRGGERGTAAASLRLAELSRRFPPSPDPLCDSGSAAAPPETTRPQPITARLLTSMRLALARAVALTTLKAQRAAPGTLPPLLEGRPLPAPPHPRIVPLLLFFPS